MISKKKGMALEYVFKIALYVIVFGVLVVLIFRFKDVAMEKVKILFGGDEDGEGEEETVHLFDARLAVDYVEACWKKGGSGEIRDKEISCYILYAENTVSFYCPDEEERAELEGKGIDFVCEEEKIGINGAKLLKLKYKAGFVIYEEA